MKLNTFDDTNSPMCSKCVTELGTFMHLFWYCKAVYSFWEKIHKAIQDMCNCTLELCPILYLLNYDVQKKFPTQRNVCLQCFPILQKNYISCMDFPVRTHYGSMAGADNRFVAY